MTLLVVDGVMQAWGVAATVLGLIIPERATKRATAFQVAPAQLGAGAYGAMAIGSF